MRIAANSLAPLTLPHLYEGEGILQLEEYLDKAKLHGMGRRVGLMTIPPGCSIGKHTHHGEFEFYYVLSGEGAYSDDEQSYQIAPGDFTLCDAEHSHAVVNEGTEELRLFIGIINLPSNLA